MKQNLSKVDARKNISAKFQDARQLLKMRKQNPKSSVVHDARFKIRAKKFQPLKQEMLKIKFSGSSKAALALPGRTIMNKGFAGLTNRAALSKFEHKIADPSPRSSFVSVRNGKRKLLDKVTVHQAGLKIAVRNELAALPKERKSIPSIHKNEQPLKITLNNPGAVKRQTASYPLYKPKMTRHDFSAERLRRKHESHPFVIPSHVSPSPSRSSSSSYPSSSNYRLMPHAQHISPTNTYPITSKQAMSMSSTSRYEASHDHTTAPSLENYSPLEGTKILVSNLHPVVVEDDILELFSVVGPVRRARMVGMCKAEVVFVKRDDAILAYQKYNNRDLDGQPMIMKLLLHQESSQNKISYSWMNDIGRRKSRQTMEIDPAVLQRSLFKSSSAGPASSPVVFTVKI